MDPLSVFSEPTREWFRRAFDAPTPAQEQGWPAIASGEHVLIQAPTGSGKTLAAFLTGIDRLTAEPGRGLRLLYVSPLKALNYDVERNLRGPLAGLRSDLRVAVHVPQIHGRLAAHDPLRQRLAGAGRRGDTDGVEAGRHVEVPALGRLAEHVAAVGREALGAVHVPADRRRLDRRDAHEACSIRSWKWSQSSGSSENAKSTGMPSIPHGLATGSKPPMSRPPTSSRT